MKNEYFQEKAQKAADYSADNMFERHRGAYLIAPGITCIFGNDGYNCDKKGRAKAEVKFVREFLADKCIDQLAFSVDSEEGCSWAMLVDSAEAQTMSETVWEAWKTVTADGYLIADSIKPPQ